MSSPGTNFKVRWYTLTIACIMPENPIISYTYFPNFKSIYQSIPKLSSFFHLTPVTSQGERVLQGIGIQSKIIYLQMAPHACGVA